MDSFYWQKMENEQQGSVNLLPPSGSASGGAPSVNLTVGDWLLSEQLGLPPPLDATTEEFNNPCLQQFMSGMVFERPNITARPTNMSVEDGVISNTSGHLHHKIEGEEMNRSYGTFSQIPQTSSAVTQPSSPLPTAIKTSPIVSNGSLMNHGCMHISSSQTPGNKRRKGLAKKVVCIPAPCATTSRPGEVVPSDLWAWRKYGQKSIKGSPYPRAYYRCSSSKGCSAKKQVERSRTNPKMLIITYMSEHNHPWPTQHNALAGSTTFHPSKTSFSASNNSSNSQKPPTILKEELNNSIRPSIQVEVQEMEKAMDLMKDNELEEVFHQRYEYNQSIDFLAEFKGLVPDPMSLIFSKGLVVDKPHEDKDSKDLDSDKHFECEVSSILEKQRGTSHNKGLDPEPYK